MEKDIGNEGTLRFELELVEGSRGLARGVPAKRLVDWYRKNEGLNRNDIGHATCLLP